MTRKRDGFRAFLNVRRYGLAVLLGGVFALQQGCAAQVKHSEKREQAQARWRQARAEIKAQLAADQLSAGEFGEAAREIDEARRLDPDNRAYDLTQARLLVARGDFDAAQRLLAERPVPAEQIAVAAEADYLLGIIAQQRLDLDGAAWHYSAALERMPAKVEYFVALAQTLLQRGATAELAALLDASRGELGWQDAYLAIEAESLEQRGEWSAAADLWSRLVQSETDSTVLGRLALALHRAARLGEALATIERLLPQLDGEQRYEWRLRRAAVQYALGNRGAAESELAALVREASDPAPALLILAQITAEREDHARALRLAKRGLEAAPDNADLLALAATLALVTDESAAAQRYARRLAAIDPHHPVARRILRYAATRD